MVDPTVRQRVREFLLNAFSISELRILVADYYPQLSASINWSGPPIAVASDVVDSLYRYGLLDQTFAEYLLRARTRRREEIQELAVLLPPQIGDRGSPATPTIVPDQEGAPVRIHVVGMADDIDPLVSAFYSTLAKEINALEVNLRFDRLTDSGPDLRRSTVAVPVLSSTLVGAPFFAAFRSNLEEAATSGTTILPIQSSRLLFLPKNWPFSPAHEGDVESASEPTAIVGVVARQITALINSLESTPSPADPHDPPVVATERYTIDRIFKTFGVPDLTCVKTDELDELEHELGIMGKGLVVEGPSGIGKSVAVDRALHRLGKKAEYLRCKAEAHQAKISTLLKQQPETLDGHWVLDDFQELDADTKRKVGAFMKAVGDAQNEIGSPAARGKITIIGISDTHQSLVGAVPDLSMRACRIRIQRQTRKTILEMIEKGERAANVHFEHKQMYATEANGSLMLAQFFCEQALRMNKIFETRLTPTVVETKMHEVWKCAVETLREQFHQPLQAFCMLDADTQPRGAGLALLYSLKESPESAVAMNNVRPRFPQLNNAFVVLGKGLATAGNTTPWKRVIYCNIDTEQLVAEDPKVEFYLRQLPWIQFAHECGVTIRESPDAGLEFIDADRPTPNPIPAAAATADAAHLQPGVAVSEGVVRILHLSDFHFRTGTQWDSQTVLGRLTTDLTTLVERGQAPDFIVITGDIAFSGQAEEYDLAKKWIKDQLLPATFLGPSELLVVPGNHDVDRSAVGITARAAQNLLLETGKQSDIAAVLGNPQERQTLLARHSAYLDFINNLGVAGQRWSAPWGQVLRSVNGVKLHFAGLCSSWMSYGDTDRSRLLLGIWQVNEVLKGSDDADVVLAAMHHPWDYYAEADKPAMAEVQSRAHVILRGHLHESAAIAYQAANHDSVIELAAGACYESSTLPNSYQLIELHTENRVLRHFPRFWNPAKRLWQAELNMHEGESGDYTMRG